MGQLIIRRFDGGINVRENPLIIDNSECPDLQNCYADDFGAITTRRGTNPFAQVQSGLTITDLFTFKRDNGSEVLLAFAGGNTYFFNSITSAFNSIPSGTSVWNNTTGRVFSMQYQDTWYGTDETSRYKITGSFPGSINFTRMGVSAPSGVLSFTTTQTNAGTLTGSYLYGYTYMNSLSVESNLCSFMTTPLALGSAQASIGGFQTAFVSYGVNGIRLYRTLKNTTTPYYFVTSLASDVSTYTDNATDGSITVLAPTDNGTPPPSVAHIMFKDRAWFAGGVQSLSTAANKVSYSQVGTPEIVSALAFQRFGWEGEAIRTIAAPQDALIIGKTKSMWELQVFDPGTPASWFPRKLPSANGSETPFLAVPFSNKLLTLSRKGFSMLSYGTALGGTTTQIPTQQGQVEIVSDKIYIYPLSYQSMLPGYLKLSVNTNNFLYASGIGYRHGIWLSMVGNPGTAGAVADTLWYFDYFGRDRAATPYGWFKMQGPLISAFSIYGDLLYGATSSSDSWIYQLEVSDQYFDKQWSPGAQSMQCLAISSYFKTKNFSGLDQEQQMHKDWRNIRVAVSGTSGLSMRVAAITGTDTSTLITGFLTLDPTTNDYGTADAGNRIDVFQRLRFPPGVMGKTLGLQFQNYDPTGTAVSGLAFKVLGLDIDYYNRGNR